MLEYKHKVAAYDLATAARYDLGKSMAALEIGEILVSERDGTAIWSTLYW